MDQKRTILIIAAVIAVLVLVWPLSETSRRSHHTTCYDYHNAEISYSRCDRHEEPERNGTERLVTLLRSKGRPRRVLSGDGRDRRRPHPRH